MPVIRSRYPQAPMRGRLKRGVSRRDFVRAGTALGVQEIVGTSLFTLGCDVSHFGPQRITIPYHKGTDPLGQLSGVDNLALTPTGDLIIAEDGGNMELVMLDASGLALALLRVEGQPFSELAGSAFDPRGGRLYFSSQRGTDGRGITYEVRGPFESRRRNALARSRNL